MGERLPDGIDRGFRLLAGAALYWYLDRVAPGMVGARELAAAEAPLLRSTVERLAARAGVARPRLYFLDDGHPRAFAAGRGPRGSSLTVSAGLLSAAPPAELDGSSRTSWCTSPTVTFGADDGRRPPGS